jgi:hypothetical protein
MAQRKDTAANWTAANPILLSGEIGYETDTKKFKIGDGTTNWNTLAYLPIPDGSGNLTITGNLEIGTTGSLTFEGSTANGFETTLAVTDPTADRTITLPNVSGTVVTTGDTGSITSTMLLDGTIVNADISDIAEIAVSKLANGTANQVIVTDGTNVSWSDNLTLAGDLIVNGTTTTINTQELLVEDKNIIIGNVTSPTDVTADGGGITLKGATDKTINWVDSTDAWTSSERFSYPLGSATAPALTFTGDPNTGLYSPGADQVAISTNGSERIRIKSDGITSFGQGATGPGAGVAGTLINAGDGGILITNNTAPFLRCYTLNGGFPDALQIAANGNVTNANNSYGAISDAKLKENIVDANSQWNDLKAFRVRNYNLKEGQTHTQIGLVAQEAELVSPGIVSESPDCDAEGNDLGTTTKSVNYSVLYMKAVKALQEAMERIEVLEQRLTDAGIA